ncbi:MAG: hypothetical protein ACJ746_22290 [Bryobacteraceae bacterium]
MLDLNATVHEIVERSFPELRNLDISCRLTETAEDFLAGIQWNHTDPPKVVISFSAEDVKQMSDLALTGCIVHELCHAEYDFPLAPSVFAANDQQYNSDPAFRTAHEREIDLAVIKKGYGRELLALQNYHNQHYDAYQPSDGLTAEETQAIMDQITDL